MKNILPVILFGVLFTSSCNHKENNNDETSIHARADSIVGMRMMEINQQSMEDLEKRMAIEVKAKADSIVAVANGTSVSASPATIQPQRMDAAGSIMRRPGSRSTNYDSTRIR